MAKLITVYWRALPAQVIGRRGRSKVKQLLPQRFQVAIDRAAMRAGKGSSDLYLEEWRRVSTECGDDVESEVAAAAARLDAEYDDERLERIAKAGGNEP